MWSSELARHLQFDLVDTEGMTEDQLREIPYTVVETHRTQKKPTSSSLKVSKTANKITNGVDRIRKYERLGVFKWSFLDVLNSFLSAIQTNQMPKIFRQRLTVRFVRKVQSAHPKILIEIQG